jgi:hypothetical protein
MKLFAMEKSASQLFRFKSMSMIKNETKDSFRT